MAVSNLDLKCDVAWCPGCGNYGILTLLKEVITELALPREKLVMVSGIGQAAKIPQYFKTNYFNGLHGRALPPATAIKASNPELTVIAESGDGDMYGEGGNHFIHCIRRNPDIKNFVHNNMVYGLTKGQASPTSERGFVTPVQIGGVILEPFNPIAVAIALDASFVARAFVGHQKETKTILKEAIEHHGYALVDIFQPCVTFNKINTYQWFREHTYYLDEKHVVTDRAEAFRRAIETDKLPLGIFYKNPDKKIFEEQLLAYRHEKTPLFQRSRKPDQWAELMKNLVSV
ncbi:MAG: 2-oxoacid ferredoxin oxidoreductase [Omnitrophica bacterium RIFCSPLOWO2_12_FULL_44_17]|uniref:2-oxoacid ferredoxin oxidoreductase n=1 Tax=Candidatus Danuiimicrobium aquiferis TaxID=1801832 RepID=A0A1G1KZG6_9BACT|nr:MAG: 2-oxoacid ferredoxin oxidoreductase [Omnitrophica bacterium RIFCSPHIGHO2_02_FULL_45_28]OGW89115.1 MAG: 2-oxoacid ferredoxin oxidoreductase [Omnitrophica bacterium RIFCSPHIGHO2_12_FULL_44_12]OGW98296.1 MAG: 2-oxoacid ferredoxin oxidoreductase [Omnitrophica bacterium RIFCSPLOWO2_12_FULL_44_17]OGX02890.1 MAG: 2-oxoacid ferredoxin oxidoreductase [Omnitrophica bacterium RIFCSPLOWO2_02_FULL_44_11]